MWLSGSTGDCRSDLFADGEASEVLINAGIAFGVKSALDLLNVAATALARKLKRTL
ncbi:hypothetical protein [Sphingomonas xinjiangensis]|uniref:Uncharacterized protein n=1 Tax=Sphingomonas xinjiangensis TaxID=643568 RepID=A0A840YMH8_9SPHN|nr:hypothetical protein [Sphingomonas xinjiangensis]MBB5710820.1 hypothetical protein [Sphingomonas xinjiangensis]